MLKHLPKKRSKPSKKIFDISSSDEEEYSQKLKYPKPSNCK